MTITLRAQGVFDLEPVAATFTVTTFNVPSGTDTLLILPIMRGSSSASAAAISSITHNGGAVTVGFNNYAAGNQDIDCYIGYRRSPDVGTFNIVINNANTGGGVCWVLALSGVKSTGSPIGATNAQRTSSSTATSVGLGLTPSSDSMLLTALASGNNTGTVTGFTGTGFTETATGRYGGNGDQPTTLRYLTSATATAKTVSATFSAASPNCGGLLAEILAEVTGTDVAGTAAATLDVVGSISSGLSKAEVVDASFRQVTAWTEILPLQADAAGVARRILSAGVTGAPTLTIDQLAPGKNYSCRYRLADGNVQIDSGTNTQSLSAQHLAFVHNGALGPPSLYLNGVSAGTVVEGAGLTGALVVQGGETIGAHGGTSPAPYTGLVGRYLLAGFAMTAEQIQLLALSETDPGALWGVGVEDDAQVTNQSVVACPLHTELDGQPSMMISPRILDPSGGVRSISAATQPANGTLAISGLQLDYTPNRGWQGSDSATYTATDGATSSTGRLTFRQKRAALKLTNDSITVTDGGILTFDPRGNDVGAGALKVVDVSTPASGAVTILADGRLKYSHRGTGGGGGGGDDIAALAATFIHVYPMAISTAAPGDIIRPAFDATHTNLTNGLGSLAGKIVDWRGRVGSAHYAGADKNDNTIFRINSATATTVFCGGSTKETNVDYVNGAWAHTHGNDATGENSPAMKVDVAPLGVKFQGFYFKDAMDGIIPAPTLGDSECPTFENFCVDECHDDTIQNDGARKGIYRNGLMKGHVWFSVRPGGTPTLQRSTFEYCLIHMNRRRYATEEPEGGTEVPFSGSKRSGRYVSPTERNNTIIGGTNLGWATKFFIKTAGISGGVYKAKADMSNCLLRIDGPPVEGYGNPGEFPTDWTYSGVHVCWLGPPAGGTGYGPWPFLQSKAELATMGITLHDDEQEAYDLWTEAERQWREANGYDSVNDDFAWTRFS